MREILFRGKRVDNGEWVYGYYIKATHHWHEKGIHEDWIAVDTIQNGGWCNVRGMHAVAPETVGQFTGLTDINGKRIFEGDICLCDRNIHHVLAEQVFEVMFFPRVGWVGESAGTWSTLSGNDWDCAEVVGNIHDNPELMEVDK